jgi:hypothetical protein
MKISHTKSSLSAKISAFFTMIALLLPLLLIQPFYKVSAEIVQGPMSNVQSPEPFSVARPSIFTGYATAINTIFLSLFSSAKVVEGLSNGSNEAEYAANSSMFFGQPAGSVAFDFDGDNKADLARWQRSSSEWKVNNSSTNTNSTTILGTNASAIAPGKFDSDPNTDYAVFNAGTWTIKQSSTNTTTTITGFGQSGDKPVIGDYDGDGLSDLALYRPSNGTWYVTQSTNNAVVST